MFDTLSFQVSSLGLIISVAFRIVAAVYYVLIIRRALQEVEVKNGLISLRKQLLTTGVVLFLINTLGMGLLIVRPFFTPTVFRVATDSLLLVNSLGFFLVAYILYKIYTQQYTPEQIEHHRKIAVAEEAFDK